MDTLLRLWRLLAPFKWRVALSILLGLFTIGANIGLMATSGYLIASAALHPSTILLLWVPIVGVRFFGIARAVFRYLERLVSHDVTFRILARLRVWVYEQIEPLIPGLFIRKRRTDVLSTLVSDVDTLQDFYLRVVAPPGIAVSALVLVFAILARYSVGVAAMDITMLLITGLVLPYLANRFGQPIGRCLVSRRADVQTEVADLIQGLPEILAFGREKDALQSFSMAQGRLAAKQFAMGKLSGYFAGLTALSTHITVWLVLVVAIPLVGTGHISGIDLTVVVLTTMAGFEAVSGLSVTFQYFGQAMAAARRVFAFGDESPAVENPVYPLPVSKAPDLSIRNLEFGYGRDSTLALKAINVEIPAGRKVAIVGHSGAGKTTLLNLLLRLWDYDKGEICLDGVDYHRIDEETIRRAFAVVSQDTFLFNATILDNIRLGHPEAAQEEVERAAKAAQIHEFVMSLPEAYQTFVGEAGAKLSGGEMQRIALARALLRNGPILVFDEPTTGLDAVTESEFLKAMEGSARARTQIVITHRLLGLSAMDEILVLDRGMVVERGKHDALLAQGGLYRTLWDLQRQIIPNTILPIQSS
jgi:thiol reductant ABC exporter CydC subunit